MTYPLVEVGEFMVRRGGSVDPSKFKDELFELHSIPAFDAGQPEVLLGSQIGSSKQIVQPDDVMISKIVPHIRRSSVVGPSSGSRQIASGEWIVFRSERIYPHYLRHVLISNQFNSQFMATVSGVGGSLLRARPAEVAKIKVPLPPISEQRRIATILDKADALRAKRREAIAKLDQLLQSVFLEMFGDETDASTTVAGITDSASAIRTGPFGSQLLHSEFVDSGIVVLGIDNAVSNQFAWGKPRYITEQKYSKLSRYRVLPGDVLITIMGTCGRCVVVPEDIPLAINTKHLCCISLDRSKCEPEFLHSYFLMHPIARNYLESRAKGAIMSGLNMGIIKELPVALPSIERQRQFVSVKMQLRQQRARSEFQLARLEHLFAAIQDQAFAGTL